MITMLPLLLGLAALICAVVIMVRQSRSAGRRLPASAAGDPLFFVRYRPDVSAAMPARTAPRAPDRLEMPPEGAENAPKGEKP